MKRIVLLGTGASAGVPQIGGADGRGDWGKCDPNEWRNRRRRSSIVIEATSGFRLLVDTGPDLKAQLIDNAISRIDGIFFTHPHADHISGLDEVRILNRIIGRPMPTYADAATWQQIRTRFAYAFRPSSPPHFFHPALETQTVTPGERLSIGGLEIEVIGQDHGVLTSLGLRIGGFAYSTDAMRLDEQALAALAGLDCWVVGCFQRYVPHPTHAHLERVLEWVEQLKPRRTVLTHMGYDMDWEWLKAHLPAGVEPGWDGMVVEIVSRSP